MEIIYIYIINKVKWNVKKGFLNFIFYVISIITEKHLLFSYNWKYGLMVRVWLVLSLKVVLWLYLY